MEEKNKLIETMIAFADTHLQPYKITRKIADGSGEIIPTLCPFCHGGDRQDQNTFALSIDKGVYVCKRGSCGQTGNYRKLVEYLGGNPDAIPTVLNGKKGSKQVQYVLPTTKLFPVTDEIYAYMETRKISRATVDAMRIQSDEHGNIVFPFYENGINVFEKYRKPHKQKPGDKSPKEWRSPGTRAVLFNMDSCTFSKPLVITEGQMDAMSLYEAGITNVVSVPSGCEDMSWIGNCWEWLEKFKQIILFGDNDEPGKRMVKEVAKRLDESRCMIVEDYPENGRGGTCKDANEVLYFCGEFELISMVENAQEVPIPGLLDLGTVPPRDPTKIPRVKTMIPDLDATISGLPEGKITIFTGKTGQGKSTISGLFLLNALEQGQSVCAYSGELTKEEFLEWINFQCAGSDYIGLKYDEIRGKKVPYIPYVVQERLSKYYAGRFFLYDNNEIFDSNQADAIINVFTMAARRHGCKMFLVDNIMTSLADSEEVYKAQEEFVLRLKKFSQRFSVHVMIVAHPRKTKAGETLKTDDVGGNSAMINLADIGIAVERPNLRIIKNRVTGPLALIECCYCPDSRRIYQADKGDKNVFSWDKTGIKKPDELACSLPEYEIQMGDEPPGSSPF